MSLLNRAPVKVGGMLIRELAFELPLDYRGHDLDTFIKNPKLSKENITVHARLVAKIESDFKKPVLVYFQGGPGFPPANPINLSGWLGKALEDYSVLLLEQRGTGRSSPIHCGQLITFETAELGVEYCSHFRADNIVRDAELIRRTYFENRPWTLLGQSFGGFCNLTYLSLFPEGLEKVFFTGGIPSIEAHPDEIYKLAVQETLRHNELYFEQFPDDQALLKKLLLDLQESKLVASDGTRISSRYLQFFGQRLGLLNGMETIHYALTNAYLPDGSLSPLFADLLVSLTSPANNPVYFFLHESIYAQGFASNWSAERVIANTKEFQLDQAGTFAFTGEMMCPFLLEDIAAFRPLKELAQGLAEKSDWGSLYDKEKLSKNTVPCAAAVYYSDMYVPLSLSEDTIKKVPGIKAWVTNEYNHSGLSADGARIFDKLSSMI